MTLYQLIEVLHLIKCGFNFKHINTHFEYPREFIIHCIDCRLNWSHETDSLAIVFLKYMQYLHRT